MVRFLVGGGLVAAFAAAPALPCTFAGPPVVSDFLVVRDGDTVPTNVALVVLRTDIGPWSALVRRDDGVDVGEVFAFDGVAGVDGALDLAPDSVFLVDVPGFGGVPTTLRLTTGAGPDDEAPPAPDVDVSEDGGQGPRLGFNDGACGSDVGFTGDWGGSAVNIDFSGRDAVGFHVVTSNASGDIVDEQIHPGAVSDIGLYEFDGGVWQVAVSAIDVAGNEGDATVVDADFGGCGGCASSSSLAPAAAVLFLLLARRRRGA